jgi:hypothetical protein
MEVKMFLTHPYMSINVGTIINCMSIHISSECSFLINENYGSWLLNLYYFHDKTTQHNSVMKTLNIKWKHTKGEPLFVKKGDV